MPRRKTPRDPEQVLKIVRTLRERFISPDAQRAAKAKWDEMETRRADPETRKAARIWALAAEGGRELEPGPEGTFSDGEQEAARRILTAIKRSYPTEVATGDHRTEAEKDRAMAAQILAAIKGGKAG